MYFFLYSTSGRLRLEGTGRARIKKCIFCSLRTRYFIFFYLNKKIFLYVYILRSFVWRYLRYLNTKRGACRPRTEGTCRRIFPAAFFSIPSLRTQFIEVVGKKAAGHIYI